MEQFWEEAFQKNKEMWGFEPSRSAELAVARMKMDGVREVLIPGIGYGRNAQVFLKNSIGVTGIEISETAIALAKKHFGETLKIYPGSVTDMPFDDVVYDGVFCHALVHLLDSDERRLLIEACYRQLGKNGIMIFTAITKDAPTYGQGTLIGKDRYEMFGGVKMFFYDRHTIEEAFGDAGLTDVQEVQEQYPFYFIVCRKTA